MTQLLLSAIMSALPQTVPKDLRGSNKNNPYTAAAPCQPQEDDQSKKNVHFFPKNSFDTLFTFQQHDGKVLKNGSTRPTTQGITF